MALKKLVNMLRLPFGPYMGQPIDDIPPPYLLSVWHCIDITPSMRRRIEFILEWHRSERAPIEEIPHFPLLYFGRYIGYRPEEVPIDYLRWISDHIPVTNPLNEYIRNILIEEMQRRGVTFLDSRVSQFEDDQ